MRLRTALATLLAAALLAAGCGGSEEPATGDTTAEDARTAGATAGQGEPNPDGEAPGAPSPSKAEYIERAGAICARYGNERQEMYGTFIAERTEAGQSSQEALNDAMRVIIAPTLSEQVKEMRALGIPAGDERVVGTILRNLEAVARKGRRLQGAGDTAAINKHLDRAGRLERKYGLTRCLVG